METTYDKAVVVLGNYQEMSLPVSYLQSGTYACVYSFNKAMDQAADLASIRLVYQYAESHGYEIIGPHLAEVIMEASYLREGDGIILVKTQVPVKMASKLASKFETSDPAAVRGR